MNTPDELRYSVEHEWVRKLENGEALVGITDFAQSELGDIVYVEVETVGEEIAKDEVFGTIEAVKTTSDLHMPVSGEILEFNPAIDENHGDSPELVNDSPYDKGWIIRIRMTAPEEYDSLMSASEYIDMVS